MPYTPSANLSIWAPLAAHAARLGDLSDDWNASRAESANKLRAYNALRMAGSTAAPIAQQQSAAPSYHDQILAGRDMRFGTGPGGSAGLPFSGFNRRTVQTSPGTYTVHPMIPSYGGPMPPPPPAPMGTTADQRRAGELKWAMGRSANEHGSFGQLIPDGGDGRMRVTGIPKSPGGGPGWSYMPANKAADIYNRFAASNQALGLKPMVIGADGKVTDAAGNPMDDQAVGNAMLSARMANREAKNQAMMQSMRLRRAFSAAQRGDISKLGALAAAGGLGPMQPIQQQQAGMDPRHQAVFDMAAQMLGGVDAAPEDKIRMMAGLAGAMLDPSGAGKLPGMMGEWGAAIGQRTRTAPPSLNDIKGIKDTFPDASSFAVYAKTQGWSKERINQAIFQAFGPKAGVSYDQPMQGFYSDQIDPNTWGSSQVGIIPGVKNFFAQNPGKLAPSDVGPKTIVGRAGAAGGVSPSMLKFFGW